MWFDEHDIPYVYPHDKNESNSIRHHGGSGEEEQEQVGQVIMSIDKKRWSKIIKVFDVMEAKIKRDGDEEEDISAHLASRMSLNKR